MWKALKQTRRIVRRCVAATVDVAIHPPRINTIDQERIARCVGALVTVRPTYWSAHGNGASHLCRLAGDHGTGRRGIEIVANNAR